MTPSAAAALGVVLIAAPALPGVATRVKSFLTGRRGPPVLQLYFELWKLLRKRSVYGATTTSLFRLAPVLALVAALVAGCLLPFDGHTAVAGFAGDFMLFGGLLALGRFFIILAALDTGSSFEGLGGSRDAMVGVAAEGALFMSFAALALASGATRLSGMLGPLLTAGGAGSLPSLVMVAVSLFVLLLAETSRVPVDDPATHLELTMIHEAMLLEYSGPDLAVALYGSALRFAMLGALAAGAIAPRGGLPVPAALAGLPLVLLLVSVSVGVVEAAMARLRLNRVPLLLVAAWALSAFAAILLFGDR